MDDITMGLGAPPCKSPDPDLENFYERTAALDESNDLFSSDAVVITEQHAVAIYRNNNDGIVLRRPRDLYLGESEDACIVIQRVHLPKVIERLCELLDDDIAPSANTVIKPAGPRGRSTNAERQRRYRQRHGKPDPRG